jgi:CHAD domain-containing protein
LSGIPRAPGNVLAAAGGQAVLESARAKDGDRVHAVRVATKKLRSYWRLLIPLVGAAASRRRRRELSRAARALRGAREREVLGALARRASRSERGLAGPLAAALKRLPPKPAPRVLERALRAAAARLEDSARALAADSGGAGRRDLREGLKRLERKLERSAREARRGADRQDFHRCRKRAKDLKYALDAFGLRPRAAARCGRCADELGDARDLRQLAFRARLEGGRLEKMARKLERSGLSRL